MASEITYAEVRFKNESNSSGSYSDSPEVPKVQPTPHPRKPGSPSLLFTSLMALSLLLAISFLVAFIIYFQKYTQLLKEKKEIKEVIHTALNCTEHPSAWEACLQKYSQLLEEQKSLKDVIHTELSCVKHPSPVEDKVWSCCPKGWKPFSSHCYFISTVKASWNVSEEKCSSMGAHLLVIHSKEQQDFITRTLENNAAYFIGLWDPGHRQWRWVDQTPYNENATFWHQGEPSSQGEQCVMLNNPYFSGWGWNDARCNGVQKSICQMKRIYL